MKLKKNGVFGSAAVQLWKLFSGPLTLLLIPIFISPEIQGYWYTFGSICALAIFADLGFTTIIMQFSAHEYSGLILKEDGILNGDAHRIAELSSLFRYTIKWALSLVIFAFPLIFIIGSILFQKDTSSSNWFIPWLIYTIGSGIGFFNSAVTFFIMGCDQVAKIQKKILTSLVINTTILLILLVMGTGLFALAIGMCVSNILLTINVILSYRKMLNCFLINKTSQRKWGKEILSLLWKYAVSWSSGYLIFQIYTPLMFMFHGSVNAGKVGISVSLATAFFNISNSWISANIPKFNIYVSQKKWYKLDRTFKKNLILSLITYLIGIIVLLLSILILKNVLFVQIIMGRFIGVLPFVMLLIGWFFQIIVNGLATYMRAHKEEPLVLLSIFNGVYIVITTYIVANFLNPDFFFLGFFSSFFFTIPWIYIIYRKKRILWHSPSEVV